MTTWDAADFFESATADTVMACIRAGMDVHVRDEYGATPMHKAAWRSPYPAVITALLAAGADINARDEDGDTPLHHAAGSNRNPDILIALLENGAEVNAPNRGGDTPLHEEAGSGIPANIRALLEAGAGLDARNREGETPLHHAVARDKPANVSALLEGGADVQAGGRVRRHAPAQGRAIPSIPLSLPPVPQPGPDRAGATARHGDHHRAGGCRSRPGPLGTRSDGHLFTWLGRGTINRSWKSCWNWARTRKCPTTGAGYPVRESAIGVICSCFVTYRSRVWSDAWKSAPIRTPSPSTAGVARHCWNASFSGGGPIATLLRTLPR